MTRIATAPCKPDVPRPMAGIATPPEVFFVRVCTTAAADIFVTGDKEVQSLKHVGEMTIVSPRDFWNTLTAQQGAQGDG